MSLNYLDLVWREKSLTALEDVMVTMTTPPFEQGGVAGVVQSQPAAVVTVSDELSL
jgi:hypothetical protein